MSALRLTLVLAAAITISTVISLPPPLSGTVVADESESGIDAGEVVKVTTQRISLPSDFNSDTTLNMSGNSSDAVDAPHLVELHTATWCIPCRTAEAEVGELDTWWPAVETIALHSSLDSPDELATNVSSEVFHRYRLGGYPTIVVDGNWLLLGESQSRDLQSLLTNLTEDGRPVQGSGEVSYSWQVVGENFSISWNANTQMYVSIDFLLTQEAVPWPDTSVTLDHVVRGGLSNLSTEGSDSFQVNVSGGGDLTLTTILRIEGNASLVAGSDTPLTSGLPDAWEEPPVGRTLSPEFIAGLTLLILFLAMVPMRHTLPLLWQGERKKRHDSAGFGEE